MDAVALVAEPVGCKGVVIADVDVDTVPRFADGVVADHGTVDVVQVDAVAAILGTDGAVAGDAVALHQHVRRFVEPDAKAAGLDPVVVDVGVAGVARDENGGIEVGQVGAAVADQQVAYRDIGCGNGQRRSLAIAVNDGSGLPRRVTGLSIRKLPL